jgi:hypothetical protein
MHAADQHIRRRQLPVRRTFGCFATDGRRHRWGILTHSEASYPIVSSDTAAVSLIEDTKLKTAAAIDALKIEVEVLRRFMERYHPDFAPRYAELRAQGIQEVNPEWIEPGSKGSR